MYRFVLPALFACSIVLPTAGTCEDLSPLNVSYSVNDAKSALEFTIVNTSQKDIVAYAVAVDFVDQSGAVVIRGVRSEIADPDILEVSVKKPGQAWTPKPFRLPSPDVTPKVRVDFVQFDDNTTWGPDTSHEGARLQGMITGI